MSGPRMEARVSPRGHTHASWVRLYGDRFAVHGWQLRRNALVQRAQFLRDTTQSYFAEDEVRRLYYDLDYGQFTIEFVNETPETFTRRGLAAKPFIGSDEERWLDNLLYTLDTIGRIVESGILNEEDATIFAFQAVQVFRNPTVQQYLKWLDNERERFGGELPTHRAARELVKQTERKRQRSRRSHYRIHPPASDHG